LQGFSSTIIYGFVPVLGLYDSDEYISQLKSATEQVTSALQTQYKGKEVPYYFTIPKTISVPITWLTYLKQDGEVNFCPPYIPPPVDTTKSGTESTPAPAAPKACVVESTSFNPDNPDQNAEVALRWDRLIVILGLLTILTIIYVFMERIIGKTILPWDGTAMLGESLTNAFLKEDAVSAHLAADISNVSSRADALFARSSLMLIAGIIVAFVGITVYAFLTTEHLPDPVPFLRPDKPPTFDELIKLKREDILLGVVSSIARNFRYVIIFIFVETIAWFLLRQYIALIEDYKTFYRLFLRRQNYLVSYLMLKDVHKSRQPPNILIPVMMLHEDLSGTVEKNRSLESQT
jgi:hypothetical protein